jgi:peroxiredoxin
MSTPRIPPLPLGPGRSAIPKRARPVLAVVLAAVVVAIVVGGVLLARSSGPGRPRVVTIPAADRNAPPALIRAAEAVGFRPATADGVGKVEDRPAGEATELTDGLLPVGSRAPAFTLRTPAGRPISLRSLRGKAVLLEFFATWCPHCAAEAPHLRALSSTFPRSKVAFLAIEANGGDAPSVFAYHVYFGLPFPAVFDPGSSTVTWPAHGHRGPVSKRYGVGLYPTFYVLDRRGRVTWRSGGEQPDALLARELGRAMRAGEP